MIEVVKLSDIIKRGKNVYWFNKRIPADLQKHFGGREKESFSLKTTNRDAALRKAQEIREEWEALRSAPPKSERKTESDSDILSSEELELWLTSKELDAIEARFKVKIQSRINTFESALGCDMKTLVATENRIITTVRRLEALLIADDLPQSALESVGFKFSILLHKTNLYQVCLDASKQDTLDEHDCRRVARRVIAVLIDGYTEVQKMIEKELCRPADLSKTQKHIRETKPNEASQPASPANEGENKKLSEVWDDFVEDKEKLAGKTIDLMESAVNLLTEWHGDRPISAYSRKDLVAFRNECLLNLPARRKKNKKWDKFSLKECCAKDKLEDVKIAPKTVNNYLAYICSVFSYAYERDYVRKNQALNLEIDEPDSENRAFTKEELKKLWENLRKNEEKPSHYWSVVISMYTGMRLNEICQLQSDDIYKDDESGIEVIDVNRRVIDVNQKKAKKIKTASSRRIIPIHPKLIALGLLEFLNNRKKELGGKTDMLFCDVTRCKYGKYTKNTSYWFNNVYKPSLFEKRKYEDGYRSFRPSFTQQCQNQAGMDDRVNQEITGHELSGVTKVHLGYARGLTIQKLFDQLKKLKYDFE